MTPQQYQRHFPPAAKRTRGSRACDHCRKKRTKCSGGQPGNEARPCHACVSLKVACEFSSPSKRRGPQRRPNTPTDISPAPTSASPSSSSASPPAFSYLSPLPQQQQRHNLLQAPSPPAPATAPIVASQPPQMFRSAVVDQLLDQLIASSAASTSSLDARRLSLPTLAPLLTTTPESMFQQHQRGATTSPTPAGAWVAAQGFAASPSSSCAPTFAAGTLSHEDGMAAMGVLMGVGATTAVTAASFGSMKSDNVG
ncbi:hypothetical protein HK101_006187, partial [Irineochytrium annulatum]